MKRTLLTVAAAALLALPTVRAQENKPADKPAGDKPAGERPDRPRGGGGRFSPEEAVKRMTEQLSLTPEQVEKVKAIYAKNGEAMKALRDKGRDNLTEEDRTKMREMFRAQQEEVVALLTPEQKKKYEEARAQRGGGEGRRPGGDKPADKPEAK
jgi:Spy/CpxP family protein refolding chaperone